jgi:DNA topoisomerase-1
MSKLLIIESPNKIKSIKKYLGSGYEVMATKGHIRDLPKSKLGVDIENGFAPQYSNMPEKKELIKSLKQAAADSDEVFLATDPDREGEAISWHLAQILALDFNDANRVTFNEITESGVKAGIKAPRKLDINLVDAQQARRVLDRLVGYKVSPIICKKIAPKLSAGRVQSVALKLVVEREIEIEKFVPEEFWTVCAMLKKDKNEIKASLATYKKKKFVPKKILLFFLKNLQLLFVMLILILI